MPSVFLSHSWKDKFFVRELAQRLESYGIKVWLDEAEINVGDSLTKKIGEAIDETDFVIVVLSSHSVNSEWVQRELQIALQGELSKRRVTVLPILRERVDIPPFLRDKLYADFTTPEEAQKSLPRLLRALGIPQNKITPIIEPRQESKPPHIREEPQASSVFSSAEHQLVNFQDINIVDLDVSRSEKPDSNKLLYNMYLLLSDAPPLEWQQIFSAERQFPRHTMWRHAWIEGQYIVIHCVPDELEKYHFRDLREDANNANMKYRQYLTEQAQKETKERHQYQTEQDELLNIRRRLGFS